MSKLSKRARTDNKGVVVVSVALTNAAGERIKGNLTRSFKVSGATVSNVANVIEQNFVRPDLYTLRG